VTAGGSLILTRDRKLGNSDDITMTGSFVVTELPAKKQGNFKAGAFPLVTLDAGSYYLGTKFTAIDMMTNEIITQDFVTPKRVLQVVGTQLGSNSLDGTAGADSITFQSDGTNNYASLNGIWHTVPSGTTDLFVNAGTGDDTIVATSDFGVSLHVSGAGGNDTMIGGAAADELSGGNGYDKIYGGAGNDHLIGGANKDSLDGQAGNDTLSGGGGNDRLGDQFGNNYLIGGIGNDVFNVRNASADTVSGNTGEDQALLDANDYRSGIESLL
jgi:Ca2+-binding RTX toxin-like protein